MSCEVARGRSRCRGVPRLLQASPIPYTRLHLPASCASAATDAPRSTSLATPGLYCCKVGRVAERGGAGRVHALPPRHVAALRRRRPCAVSVAAGGGGRRRRQPARRRAEQLRRGRRPARAVRPDPRPSHPTLDWRGRKRPVPVELCAVQGHRARLSEVRAAAPGARRFGALAPGVPCPATALAGVLLPPAVPGRTMAPGPCRRHRRSRAREEEAVPARHTHPCSSSACAPLAAARAAQVPEPAVQQRRGRELAVPGRPGALHAAAAAGGGGQRARARVPLPGHARALLPRVLPHVAARAAARRARGPCPARHGQRACSGRAAQARLP